VYRQISLVQEQKVDQRIGGWNSIKSGALAGYPNPSFAMQTKLKYPRFTTGHANFNILTH
jgi:hypothetical protein